MRRIDEILALPESADDFKDQELPPSDDDSWLYGGEDELNTVLQERQKEMELYNSKKKQKSKEQDGPCNCSDNFDLKDISKSMQAFVTKTASYEGAEVPEDRFLFFISLISARGLAHAWFFFYLIFTNERLHCSIL